MFVTFKKILRKSPFDKEGTGKFYPQLITWGKPATLDTIAKQMKEKSSLTLGDIKSVLTNFVEVMRSELYNGHAVNIENFGVFSLSATTVGTDTKKACLPENIHWVRINFRASASVRPNLAATRAEDRLDFVDLEQQLKALNGGEGGSEVPDPNPGGGSGGDGGDEEAPDPTV